MPNRCARCGSFAGRGQELPLPGEWLEYLQRERGVQDPVGTLKLPLCRDCVGAVEEVRQEGDPETRRELLDSIDVDRLIDDH